MARDAARALIDALEVENRPIEQCLMLASRVARLMRDADAQAWLERETRGYPVGFDLASLGTCAKYAWRLLPEGKIVQTSLPALEANVRATATMLEKMQGGASTSPTKNYLESDSTRQVIETMNAALANARNAVTSAQTLFAQHRASLHRYACDILIALEIGDVAEAIFEEARVDVDQFVRAECPQAAEQLVAVSERMREGNAEALSSALTTCRRMLATVADAVFPPQAEPYVDGKGKERKAGNDAYKNRLLAFLEQNRSGSASRAVVDAEVEHLAARVDAIYEKACKGVHADVTLAEARLIVIQTYLVVAEVARAHAAARERNGATADESPANAEDNVPPNAKPKASGKSAKR